MSLQVLLVSRVFLDDVSCQRFGWEVMKATGLSSGTVYPILARLELAGVLVSAEESIDPVVAGRPARRYYKLEPNSVETLRQEVATYAEMLRVPSAKAWRQLRPKLAGA